MYNNPLDYGFVHIIKEKDQYVLEFLGPMAQFALDEERKPESDSIFTTTSAATQELEAKPYKTPNRPNLFL
jgi:hypothetical protein